MKKTAIIITSLVIIASLFIALRPASKDNCMLYISNPAQMQYNPITERYEEKPILIQTFYRCECGLLAAAASGMSQVAREADVDMKFTVYNIK